MSSAIVMEPLDHRMSRILRLTHYLDHNLGESLSVNQLAAQACYSPFHFLISKTPQLTDFC